jgi:hypothetical protein
MPPVREEKTPRSLGLPTSFSVMYNYVRGRQLEGTYNNDPTIGYWPITALRIARGWGMPTEEQWPYVGDASLWPPKEEPANIDQLAKRCRLFAYQRVRSEMECKLAIAEQGFVTVAVDITDSWFDARMGKIQLPKQDNTIAGAHCVLLCGYNDNEKIFNFANSWGEKWGDRGFGYLPYQYIDRFLKEAWIILPHEDSAKAQKTRRGIEIRYWGIPSIMHGILHGVEIRDSQSDEREAWAFALEYDGYLNVEELFVRPTYRRSGYFNHLFGHFQGLSNFLSVPLRFWVSHTDAKKNNIAILRHIANKHSFIISNSSVRWASFKIEKTGTSTKLEAQHSIPGVAHRSLHRLPV